MAKKGLLDLLLGKQRKASRKMKQFEGQVKKKTKVKKVLK